MSSELVSGKCALCLNERELEDSHIIPDFLFKRVRRGAKYFYQTNAETGEHQRMQDTPSEYLLCGECEDRFEKWETKVAMLLFGPGGSPRFECKLGQDVVLDRADYAAIKLLQMSILWRLGVTKNSFLTPIDLGAHTEALRKLLLAEDPSTPWKYGCFAQLMFLENADRVFGISNSPHYHRGDAFDFVVIYVDGVRLFFPLLNQPGPAELERYFIAPRKPLVLGTYVWREARSWVAMMEASGAGKVLMDEFERNQRAERMGGGGPSKLPAN